MFGRLFGKKKVAASPPKADEDSPLMLATDDRDSFTETPSSQELAHKLLSEAQLKAAGSRAGAEVSVDIDERYPAVHHMELDLSLMMTASQYGLEWVASIDNTVQFKKL